MRFDRRGNQMHVNLWLIWVDDFTCKRWLVIMRHFERTGMLIDSLGRWVPGTSGVVITGLQHYLTKKQDSKMRCYPMAEMTQSVTNFNIDIYKK